MEGKMKQKGVTSVTSFRNGEEFKGKEKRILLQSEKARLINAKEVDVSSDEGGGKRYLRTEFHLIDLKADSSIHCLPSLAMFTIPGSMVALDNFVYIFGGLHPGKKESEEFKLLQSQSPQSYEKFYMGGSRVDFDPDQSEGAVWGPAPIPINDRISSNCTTFLGKIYTFGSYLFPEVLDPTVGHWQQLCSLPHELVDCRVSHHPLPDPSNHRIFLHLALGQLSAPSLYTFKPPEYPAPDVDGKWECVHPDFQCWTHVATVFEDVIYFHKYKYPSLLRAYDVASGKWLNVSWDSFFEDNVDMNNVRMEFDALISLGDGILCFAGWTPIYAPGYTGVTGTRVPFYKFRVDRRDDNIHLIPLSFRSYELPGTREVLRFLPV